MNTPTEVGQGGCATLMVCQPIGSNLSTLHRRIVDDFNPGFHLEVGELNKRRDEDPQGKARRHHGDLPSLAATAESQR